jgi:hypothetical protein
LPALPAGKNPYRRDDSAGQGAARFFPPRSLSPFYYSETRKIYIDPQKQGIGVYFSSAGNYKKLKNLYRKGASNQGSEANKNTQSDASFLPSSPSSPLRLLFSLKPCDCERVFMVKK